MQFWSTFNLLVFLKTHIKGAILIRKSDKFSKFGSGIKGFY